MLNVFRAHGRTVNRFSKGTDMEISLQLLLSQCQSDPVFSFILPLLSELERPGMDQDMVTWTDLWRLAEGAMKVGSPPSATHGAVLVSAFPHRCCVFVSSAGGCARGH